MARIQILELPTEHHGDDMATPFVLIVDQADYDSLNSLSAALEGWQSVKDQIGARAVLVFEETVEIPANDHTAYRGEVEERAETPRANERAIEAEEKLKAFMEKRYAIEQERKASLADALGRGGIRDWDDIRNAAAGIRKERDAQAAEMKRLRACEEPVTDERVTPTPGQWIWHFNRATPEKRLSMAAQILDSMPTARNCFMADHEAQIERLREEVERLRTERSSEE